MEAGGLQRPGASLDLRPAGPTGGQQPRSGFSALCSRARIGRLGQLEIRLAASAAEVRQAQALRYRVFYEELAAVADERLRTLGRDVDAFDTVCDHLLVLDRSTPQGRRGRGQEIVGTYRLLRQEFAERHSGFYSQREFELRPLLERKRRLRFLELGRSCVLNRYRDKRTLELLWHGVWAYVLEYQVDVMIGCASLEGTDPNRHAAALSFLHHHARAPAEWAVRAHEHLRVHMNCLPAEELDAKKAVRELPPLVKGYLRLGAYVGDGAVVDEQFGTTDICIVLPVAAINRRYVSHYGETAGRYAG